MATFRLVKKPPENHPNPPFSSPFLQKPTPTLSRSEPVLSSLFEQNLQVSRQRNPKGSNKLVPEVEARMNASWQIKTPTDLLMLALLKGFAPSFDFILQKDYMLDKYYCLCFYIDMIDFLCIMLNIRNIDFDREGGDMNTNRFGLDTVPASFGQRIHDSISRGFGAGYDEAKSQLNLSTHNLRPWLRWDLTNTYLDKAFSDKSAFCSQVKAGPFEMSLVLESNSGFLFSLMRESRFKEIMGMAEQDRPLYFRALTTINDGLQARAHQSSLFPDSSPLSVHEKYLAEALKRLCAQFDGVGAINNHGLIVFSVEEGQVALFEVYIINTDMEIVHQEDWLETAKPDVSELAARVYEAAQMMYQPKLTPKAKALMQAKKQDVKLVEVRKAEPMAEEC